MICINCKIEYSKKDPRDAGKFCCLSCYRSYITKPENSTRIRTCQRCSTQFKAWRATQKFCSNKCELVNRYASGFIANTDKAHETVKKNGFPQKKGKLIPQLHNAEVYKKISESKIGDKNAMYNKIGNQHHNWRGGKSKTIWKSVEYQRWRKDVMRRDNFTCQECGDNRGGNLEVDHIKPRLLFPELTFDIKNGRTLCKNCHKQTKTWGFKVKSLSRQDF